MWGDMYHESMESPYEVVINQDTKLGASFIEKEEVDHLVVTQNVPYAKPGVKQLKYDVFAPEGAKKSALYYYHSWRRLDLEYRRYYARNGPRTYQRW